MNGNKMSTPNFMMFAKWITWWPGSSYIIIKFKKLIRDDNLII